MTGYEALRETAAWLNLSGRGKIRVTGDDRARLLHAMSTNDVKNLATGAGVYAFFLNVKGRILADAYIYNLGDSLFLDTEPETVTTLRDHLDRYIIADDVTLENEDTKWTIIGLEGPAADAAAAKLGISVPAAVYGAEKLGAGFVANVSSTGQRGIRIFLPVSEKEKLMQNVAAAGIPQANADEARIVRIENGIPRYGDEISDRYLVQETQVLHAVHFTKGCYLGQEIVERVRSRGQVHRLLTRVRIAGNIVPGPGAKLLASGDPVAELTSAVYSPALGEVVGFAYVRAEALATKPAMAVADTNPAAIARVA